MKKPIIAVLMGSESDMPTMQEALGSLDRFGIAYEVKVLSAHRTPKETIAYVKAARPRGIKVIIAGAGGAAHLAGIIASNTTLPVIGVPMDTKSLAGIDSLLSTVQMPTGVPVATVAIGKSGAKNAGILAAQILAVSDKALSAKLAGHKKELRDSVLKKNLKSTRLIKVDPKRPDPAKIKAAAVALKSGKLVVFPTETVYGIGANANNKDAMARLRLLKERQKGPFSFHIAGMSDLKRLNVVLDRKARKLIKRFWPGPLTLVLNTNSGKGIGVRMPAHPVALRLLKAARASVVAPSANFKARNPAITAAQALEDLNEFVDMIIDGGGARIGLSSTVLDMTKSPPKILRRGAVAKKDIEKLIGRVV
jgi:tRNA threonylcarbamoyl adenosine modification protein (Sua5/YciO/YrdC/YwlC family)